MSWGNERDEAKGKDEAEVTKEAKAKRGEGTVRSSGSKVQFQAGALGQQA